MRKKLEELSTKALENIVSERKELLIELHNFATKLGKQLGEYDDSAKESLPIACEGWKLEDFHGFDIHVTIFKEYTAGVVGSTPGLCLVQPSKVTYDLSTTVHFYYNGKYMGYIDRNNITGKIGVDDRYKKGAWENKWINLMQNSEESIKNFIETRQLKTEQEQAKLKRKEAKERKAKENTIKKERLLSEAKALKVAA